MSLFSEIAYAAGHTVDSLAQDAGAGINELENLVNDLDSNGINVFSTATQFGLSITGFLRRMIGILYGDPYPTLLNYIVAPIKPADASVTQLAMQWMQMAQFHQETAQQINANLVDLFQSGGAFSYSGSAADTLWDTHQEYQHYFTMMVDHAQTQQSRHATLSSHFSDFLSQAPGRVYSLSAPMAALGVLSFEMAAIAPPPPSVLDDPTVGGLERAIEGVAGADLVGEPEDVPLLPIVLIIIGILVLILVIVVLYLLIQHALEDHQKQQKSTTVPKIPSKQVAPTPMIPPVQGPQNSLTPTQEDLAKRLYADYGSLGLSLDDIRAIIEDNPNLTEVQLRQLLAQYANVIKANPNLVNKYGALAVFKMFVALSSYDPAHGGNYATRTPVADRNLSKRVEEAGTLLGALEEGKIPWPLTPSTDSRYEASDGNGQKWDVKAWRSGMRPPFNVNDALDTIKKEASQGENVLINDTFLSGADHQSLNQAIKDAGLEGNVLWWPS